MTRHKKELMECARMLKLGNLTEHLEELLHQAQVRGEKRCVSKFGRSENI